MASSLLTALSGLKSHEGWLTVIGNNIANSNTPGFKSSRATFSDLFSQTIRFASLPTQGMGGRNPMQLGGGVKLADIGRNFGQGAINNTGGNFDLAINGRGFFMVSDGVQNLYTRVGTFGLDGSSRLVDQRTGYLVQSASAAPLQIDANTALPPQATSSVSFAGNLPAEINGPLAQVLQSNSGFFDGSPAEVTGTVDLSGGFAIPGGQTWSMELVVNGGAPLQVAFTGPQTLTTASIATAINGLNAGVTATDAGGFLQVTSNQTGSAATIRVQPGPTSTDLAGLAGLTTTLVTGSQVVGSLTTPLNNLPTNQIDYQVGDTIEVSGIQDDGTPVSGSFVFGPTPPAENGQTVGDLVDFIDNLFPGATAAFDPVTGQIGLTSDATGTSSLTLSLLDGGTVPKTNWSQHWFAVTTPGTGPDTVSTAIEVFDSSGVAHSVTFDFARQDDGSWGLSANVPGGGSNPPTITGLRFNDDGTIQTLPATTTLALTLPGQGAQQSVTLDFGQPSTANGISQYGEPASIFVGSQDGYGVGSLASLSVNSDGSVQGFYSNGQIQILGQIGIATFVNENGLQEVGDNLWTETANSGARVLGVGATGTAGQIIAGALEGSNVEIAEQFVNLIEAQRGFQANARMISTADEVLAELVNLI